jgi:hypothetical protein
VLGQQRGADLFCLCMTTPPLSRHELYATLASACRLSAAAQSSRNVFLRDFEQFLRDRRSTGARTALLIDEAQSIPTEVLEEVRLLANLESPTSKLLSVILAGQPTLARRLNDPELYALKQRVALRSTLRPLDLKETAAYIARRIRVAGGDAAGLMTKDAVAAVYQASGGIPRTISVICDNALITAFAMQTKPISVDVIAEVCDDLDLPLVLGRTEAASSSLHEPHMPEPEPTRPIAPLPIELLGTPRPLAAVATNPDARSDRPKVEGASSQSGTDEPFRRPAQVVGGPGSI